MKLSRTLKTLLLLLVSLTAGMGNAWAKTQIVGTINVNGVTYQIDEGNYGYGHYAIVTAITSTDETVTIRDYVNYNGMTLKVKYVDAGSSSMFFTSLICSTVKTLIFEGPICFVKQFPLHGDPYPTFDCESLTDIYFKGASPNLYGSYSDYFAAPEAKNLTIHVSDLTDEEIAERKDSLSPWCNFADVVPYNAAESEKVNITVTVEEAYAGTGPWFQYSSDQYINGSGTKTYTKNKFSDYTFYVADDDKSRVKNVYVNGEDVLANMTVVSSDEYPFSYYPKNPRKYTIEDVTSDVSIRITSEETVDHYTLRVGRGGKIEFEGENRLYTYENGSSCQFALDKSQTLTVTATPYEGYEFDSFLWEGLKYTSNVGNWITMETRDDGTFVANLALGTFQMPYTDNSHVVAFNFKEKPAKPTVHIQAIGTPRNVQQMYFRVDDKAVYSVDAAGLATLSRTDTLEAGSKYKLRFAGARYYNLKRITVNGEEIALPTGNVTKETAELTLSEEGDHILLEFDDIIAACSTTDGGSTGFQFYMNGGQNTINRDVATESIITPIDANQPITLVMTPDEGFVLHLFFNGTEIPLADATTPEASIPGNYMVEEDGTYQFQIPAAMVSLGSKMDFAVSYKKISFFDVNNDGEINVSDVTSLVNKILHP